MSTTPIPLRRRTDAEQLAYEQGFLAGLARASAAVEEAVALVEVRTRQAFQVTEAMRAQTTIDDHLEP